jgi:PhnB protein
MTTVNVYLTFNGNCEEAFLFYQSVFGGEFGHFSRFGEMPPNEENSMPEDQKNRIMHVSLPVSTQTAIMGSDTGGEWASTFIHGNNFSVSINVDSTAEADRLFIGLSDGGQVTMPLAATFWGSYFGMFTDKFGINWMVSCDTTN